MIQSLGLNVIVTVKKQVSLCKPKAEIEKLVFFFFYNLLDIITSNKVGKPHPTSMLADFFVEKHENTTADHSYKIECTQCSQGTRPLPESNYLAVVVFLFPQSLQIITI